MAEPDTFFSELKRRRVIRVALVYVVTGVAVVEAADLIVPRLGLPDWTVTLVVVLAILGLPVAVAMAWALQVTPDGVRRDGVGLPMSGKVAMAGAVLVLALAGGAWWGLSGDGHAAADRRSIAVLPFANTGGTDDDGFVGGIHDELLANLAKIADLRVISRTSVMAYRDTQATVREIGRELGVATVLEGGVQRVGSRIRVTAQLIDARTDAHIWSEVYDRELTLDNLLDIQSELSRRITDALRVQLSLDERERLAFRPTENLEAYEAYLRGRDAKAIGEMPEAADHFARAAALDPDFALAHAELAFTKLHRHWFARSEEDEDLVDEARESLERARRLAPDAPEVRLATGYYYYWGLRDYDRALAELEAASRAFPGNSMLLNVRALIERRKGRWTEAVTLYEKAIQLAPNAPQLLANYAAVAMWMGRYDVEEQYLRRAHELQPASRWARRIAAIPLRADGDGSALRDLIESLEVLEPGTLAVPNVLLTVVDFEILERRYDDALRRLESVDRQVIVVQNRYTPVPLLRGLILSLAGRPAEARPELERALEMMSSADPEDPAVQIALGTTYALLGRAPEAGRAADRAVSLQPRAEDAVKGAEYEAAALQVHALAGNHDRAIALLESVLSHPSPLSTHLIELDPRLNSLRTHPRYRPIIDRWRNRVRS